MKARAEHHRRREKLPPILDIDEDGVPVSEPFSWMRPRWSSDEDQPGVTLEDWPAEFDD